LLPSPTQPRLSLHHILCDPGVKKMEKKYNYQFGPTDEDLMTVGGSGKSVQGLLVSLKRGGLFFIQSRSSNPWTFGKFLGRDNRFHEQPNPCCEWDLKAI